jgi:hypothetical protein
MVRTAHGTVHGQTIQLSENLGLSEGQEVEVTVRVVSPKKRWGEGIRRSAGGMAPFWTDEDDRILEEIYQDRKRSSHRELPE